MSSSLVTLCTVHKSEKIYHDQLHEIEMAMVHSNKVKDCFGPKAKYALAQANIFEILSGKRDDKEQQQVGSGHHPNPVCPECKTEYTRSIVIELLQQVIILPEI